MSHIKVNCMLQAGGFAVRAVVNAILAHAYKDNEKEHKGYYQRCHAHMNLMDDAINHALGAD